MTKENKKRGILDKILFLVLIILVVIFLRNYLTEGEQEITETPEEKIDLTDIQKEISAKGREIFAEAIHHKGCEQCFPTENAFGFLKEQGFNLTVDEGYYEDSEKYQKLVEELRITKLPAVLLRGDIDGLEKILIQFERKGDYLVLEAPQPPYYYIPNKKIIGYVDVLYLKDPGCALCPKIGELLVDMQWKMGVGFSSKTAIYPNMTEFNELVEKYDITKVPTFIFTGDLLEYENIKKYWDRVGSIEPDGALLLRLVNPPYINPQTGEMEGLVDVIFLVGEDRENLAKAAELVRARYNVMYGKSMTISISSEEGKKLAEAYSLTGPSVIFSKEAQLYPGLMAEINDTGLRIAEDGVVVLTE